MKSHEFEEAFGNGGILDLALKLKKEGRARFIGFSSHKVPVSLKALRSGYLEVFMFPVNPAFDILPGTTGHDEILDSHNKELIVTARDIKEREFTLSGVPAKRYWFCSNEALWSW